MYGEPTLSFDDITLIPRHSELTSRKDCKTDSFGYKIPLGMSPMDTITTVPMIRLFKDNNLLPTVHRYFNTVNQQYNHVYDAFNCCIDNVYFAVGSIKKHKEWIDVLINNGVKKFIIDMAHGDCALCVDTIDYIKNRSPYIYSNRHDIKVIAGNVVTRSGFNRLQEAGADGIRVGIGSGSICSTRSSTGFGLPQYSAIKECASYKKPGTMLIADGGIRTCGDIAKAMHAGADMCFCGKMFAGTDCAGGEMFDKNKEACSIDDVCYRSYRGMASREARNGVMSYASVEGVSGLVPYEGSTKQKIEDIRLNLEASLSYAGVKSWDDFRRFVKVRRITPNGTIENQTHVMSL